MKNEEEHSSNDTSCPDANESEKEDSNTIQPKRLGWSVVSSDNLNHDVQSEPTRQRKELRGYCLEARYLMLTYSPSLRQSPPSTVQGLMASWVSCFRLITTIF